MPEGSSERYYEVFVLGVDELEKRQVINLVILSGRRCHSAVQSGIDLIDITILPNSMTTTATTTTLWFPPLTIRDGSHGT